MIIRNLQTGQFVFNKRMKQILSTFCADYLFLFSKFMFWLIVSTDESIRWKVRNLNVCRRVAAVVAIYLSTLTHENVKHVKPLDTLQDVLMDYST